MKVTRVDWAPSALQRSDCMQFCEIFVMVNPNFCQKKGGHSTTPCFNYLLFSVFTIWSPPNQKKKILFFLYPEFCWINRKRLYRSSNNALSIKTPPWPQKIDGFIHKNSKCLIFCIGRQRQREWPPVSIYSALPPPPDKRELQRWRDSPSHL